MKGLTKTKNITTLKAVMLTKYARTATLVVAAVNAKDAANADYICTGTNDDQKILSALAALPSGGGRVLLSEGDFFTGAEVNITASTKFLEGQGNATTIHAQNGANFRSVVALTGTGTTKNCLRSFTIDGNKTNQQFGTGIYIQTPNGTQTSNTERLLEDIVVQNCKNNGITIDVNSGIVPLLTRVHSKNNDGNGFYFPVGSATDLILDSCISDTNALSGFNLGVLNSHFINCKAFYNGSAGGNNHGFYISGYNNYFENCEAQDNYQSGFYSQNDGDTTYGAQYCTFHNCIGDSNNQNINPLYGCGLQAKNVKGWQIIGGLYFTRPYPTFTQRIGISLEGTTTGTKVINAAGEGNSQSLYSDTSSGINYNLMTSPPVLATGVGHTTDDVIASLQTLGLVKQL